MMAPLPLPLSDTLPAYGVLFLTLGSVERDGYVVLAGYLMVFLTVGYFSVVGVAGGMGASALWFSLGHDLPRWPAIPGHVSSPRHDILGHGHF